MNSTGHIDKISVPARPECLASIRTFIEKQTTQAGLDEKQSYNVILSCYEACSNLMRHSLMPDMNIILTATHLANILKIEITDYGKPFNPLTYSETDISERLHSFKRGGLGIHIIKSLIDEITYTSTTAGNTLTFIKFINKA